jgi:hypothetical protein
MKLSALSDAMWRRHANPLSVWSRLLSTPLVFLPLWNRSWRQGLGVAAWFAVNPFLFPEPRDPHGWAARAIRGERRWTTERPRDASLLVQGVGGAAMLAGLRSAYRRRLLPTALSAAVVMASNAWFLDRMARDAPSATTLRSEGDE